MRPRLRKARAALAVILACGAFAVSASSGGAAVRTQQVTVRAKNACGLLTAADITSLFNDAPLDPGPKKVRGSKQAKNFTRCAWDDKRTSGQPVPQLVAYTNLARDVTKTQETLLTTIPPNTNARALTATELAGLGTKGVIEIQPDGSSGAIGVLQGDDYWIVAVGYVGALPSAPILDAELLALSRKAAPASSCTRPSAGDDDTAGGRRRADRVEHEHARHPVREGGDGDR